MTQKIIKPFYLSYGTGLALITCIVLLSGCTQKPTVICLTRSLDPAYQFSRGVLVPTVGSFSSRYPESAQYAHYVQEHLNQRLAKLQRLSPDILEESQPFQIRGTVALRRLTDSKDSQLVTFQCEVTFVLYDPQSKTARQSIVFTGQTQEETQAAIQAVLRRMVDRYIDQMFPEEITIECPMARGKSQFDRRGRQAAADGDLERAYEYFRKAIDAYPDDHAALYNAGLVSEALNLYPRALHYYQRALKLTETPEYTVSLYRVREIMNTSL